MCPESARQPRCLLGRYPGSGLGSLPSGARRGRGRCLPGPASVCGVCAGELGAGTPLARVALLCDAAEDLSPGHEVAISGSTPPASGYPCHTVAMPCSPCHAVTLRLIVCRCHSLGNGLRPELGLSRENSGSLGASRSLRCPFVLSTSIPLGASARCGPGAVPGAS